MKKQTYTYSFNESDRIYYEQKKQLQKELEYKVKTKALDIKNRANEFVKTLFPNEDNSYFISNKSSYIPPKRVLNKPKKKYTYKRTTSQVYIQYRQRANAKGLVFQLNEIIFENLLNNNCIYCGIPKANGIDREDNTKGYTIDNSVSCCTKCNMMKYTYDTNTFLEHIKRIYEYNNAIREH